MRKNIVIIALILGTSILLSGCSPAIRTSGIQKSELPTFQSLEVLTQDNPYLNPIPEKKENLKSIFYDLTSDTSITKFVSPDVAFTDMKYTPINLMKISNTGSIGTFGDIFVYSEPMSALERLADDFFIQFGKKILVVSGYRSYEYQQGIERYSPECVKDGFCSRAGHSEHQSGLAVDLFETTSKEEFLNKFQYKTYYDWLIANAHKYGFTNSYRKGIIVDGYHEEPWHWRYIGRELATELIDVDKTFTEYSQKGQ